MLYSFTANNDREYVYDGEQILLLEKETYDALNISEKGITPKYLTESPINITPFALAINVVNDCNLRCSYCYANSGTYGFEKSFINLSHAKKAIDKIVEIVKINNSNFVKLVFFGGEPLLAFDEIKEVVNYTKINHPEIKFRYGTVTNGTLLSSDVIEYLNSNNFGFTVSIDGNKKSHDKYRKDSNGNGTFDRIISNINNISTLEGVKNNNDINIRLTITDDNYKIDEYIQSLLELTPVRKFTFGVDYNISSSHLTYFLRHLELMCANYIRDVKLKNYYDVTNITGNVLNLVHRKRVKAHCNAGSGYFTISNDGKIHTCHRFTGNDERAIGTIDTLDAIENFSTSWSNQIEGSVDTRIDKCKKCAFNKICGGACFYEAYVDNSNEISYSARFCKIKKGIFKNMLKFIASLEASERSDFVRYLLNVSKKIVI